MAALALRIFDLLLELGFTSGKFFNDLANAAENLGRRGER